MSDPNVPPRPPAPPTGGFQAARRQRQRQRIWQRQRWSPRGPAHGAGPAAPHAPHAPGPARPAGAPERWQRRLPAAPAPVRPGRARALARPARAGHPRQRLGRPVGDPQEAVAVGPHQVPGADRPAVLVLRVVGGVRPQPVQHLRRRRRRDRARQVVAVRAVRRRAAAPDPLPGRRALAPLLRLLDRRRVRPVREAHRPHERLEPLPAGPGDEDRHAAAGRQPRPGHDLRRRPGHRAVRAALPHLGVVADDRPAGLRLRVRDGAVRRPVLVPQPGRRRHLHARRDQDPLHRRVGAGRGRRPGQGEHGLPRPARGHRGEGRLRPGRHPAVGPARHRQDAHGRGRGRRDRQAVCVRRPGRLHPDVHGRRHPQGQEPVPQAAQAGPALRRRHRVLRRGRLPRQPRLDRRRRRAVRRHRPHGVGHLGHRPPALAVAVVAAAGHAVVARGQRHRARPAPPHRADDDGRHGHGRRGRHAPGPALGDVGPEEAEGLPQPASVAGCWACSPSRRPSTGSW